MNLVRGGTHARGTWRHTGTMLVTLGLVHHWARRQVPPTSLAFGEPSSWSFFAIFTLFGAFSLCTVGAFLVIFDSAATAAGLSTAARHRRMCAARHTPSGGPWSKRPWGTPPLLANGRVLPRRGGGSTTRKGWIWPYRDNEKKFGALTSEKKVDLALWTRRKIFGGPQKTRGDPPRVGDPPLPTRFFF